MFLKESKEGLANKDYSVENPNDLLVKTKRFKNLKAELDAKEIEMNKVSDEANQMLTDAPSGSLQELARLLMRLAALWDDVHTRVERYNKLYQTAEAKWADMRRLLDVEQGYLTSLERKVRRSSAASSDAEDISEELNDVETYLAEHSTENKRHIQELATYLIDNSIMVDIVRKDLEDFLRKNEKLESDARNKIQRLEKSIQKAQTIERQMLDMSQWMVDVTQLLQNRLDADMLAGDVPQEHETLQLEFKQEEELLEELERNVQEYKHQGKLEASARLEQQTQLLKKHFAEVMVKFRKFQRPADFEPKMTHVWRELGTIQGTIHLLEVPSDDPDAIQERHDNCMKFYKTMSELKPEVETVLKTGRLIVERKQVDFPDSLSKQLDAIKQLYNELGAQIKQSKADLEKSLKLAKKLRKELALVSEFVTSTNQVMDEREEKKDKRNLEEELNFIVATQEEVLQKEPVLSSIHDLIHQLQDLSDEVDVSESREQAYKISQNMHELSQRLSRTKTKVQEETLAMETQFIDFQTQIMKIKEWLGRAEAIVGSHSRLSEQQQRLTPHRETIKTMHKQMLDLRSQVDEIRDQAIDLMSKSDRYNRMVEPELSHINQRWEELAEKIRERQASVPPESPNVTEARTAALSSPSPGSPTRPKVEGVEEFAEAYGNLNNQMDDFESKVATEGHLTNEDFRDGLDETLQHIEDEKAKLVEDIKKVTKQGEELLLAAETSRDPVTHAKVSNKLQELKIRWLDIQRNTECKKHEISTSLPLYNSFTEEKSSFEHWLTSTELKLAASKADEHERQGNGERTGWF